MVTLEIAGWLFWYLQNVVLIICWLLDLKASPLNIMKGHIGQIFNSSSFNILILMKLEIIFYFIALKVILFSSPPYILKFYSFKIIIELIL